MKKGIHPENYRTVLFYDSNAKQGFLIRSAIRPPHHIHFTPAKQDKLPAKVALANLLVVTANSVH